MTNDIEELSSVIVNNKTNEMTCDDNKFTNDSKIIVNDILDELCDNVALNNNDHNRKIDEQSIKNSHRRTCIIYEDLFVPTINNNNTRSNRDSLYSVKEFDEEYDENDNNIDKLVKEDYFGDDCSEKSIELNQAINKELIENYKVHNGWKSSTSNIKKKFSFNSIFNHQKDKVKNVTTNDKSQFLDYSRKYHSSVDVSDYNKNKLTRKPSSLRKKLNDLQSDASNFLKRSFSLKEIVGKKKDKERSREKLYEIKNREWARSYQSLIENDTSVKYDDMSFVNYDALNQVKYEIPKKCGGNLKRTQSLYEHVSNFCRLFKKIKRLFMESVQKEG